MCFTQKCYNDDCVTFFHENFESKIELMIFMTRATAEPSSSMNECLEHLTKRAKPKNHWSITITAMLFDNMINSTN